MRPRLSHNERAVLAILYRSATPLTADDVAARAQALGVARRLVPGALRRLVDRDALRLQDGLYTVAAGWTKRHGPFRASFTRAAPRGSSTRRGEP